MNEKLFDVIWFNDLEGVVVVIEFNFEFINIFDQCGFLFLVFFIYIGSQVIVEFFLEKGVNINVQDVFGNIVLMGVVYKGYNDIVKMLLFKGVNVNI